MSEEFGFDIADSAGQFNGDFRQLSSQAWLEGDKVVYSCQKCLSNFWDPIAIQPEETTSILRSLDFLD